MIKNNIITDQEIFLKTGQNDVEAFEILYDRYAPLLYPIIKKIVHNEESASEILSETFLIVWRWSEEFDFVVNNVFTWMILLARNKAIDSLKRKRGDAGIQEYNDEYEILNILPQLSPSNESLEREYILKRSEEINSVIKTLSAEQQKLFHLVFYKGADEKNISAQLGIPAATIKTQIQTLMGILMERVIG